MIVDISRGKEKLQLQLDPVGNGRYEGSLQGLPEGEYAFTGKAAANGNSVGEDKGSFFVGRLNVEFLDTRMNKSLLEQIAYRTDGRFLDVDKSKNLGEQISHDVKFGIRKQMRSSEIELWNWRYLAAIIIALLFTEWFLRKRSGML